uniref:(California timema) hypothetical protein n=1 Tax=Timema californicum TaxID=61474 RepID=A0A7R9P857_TIMCA|nr:unnamed protein product [Timema californicum]
MKLSEKALGATKVVVGGVRYESNQKDLSLSRVDVSNGPHILKLCAHQEVAAMNSTKRTSLSHEWMCPMDHISTFNQRRIALLGAALCQTYAASQNSTDADLRSLERFRRLIPYMTFYFAQDKSPQLATYHPHLGGGGYPTQGVKVKSPQNQEGEGLPLYSLPRERQNVRFPQYRVQEPHPFTTPRARFYFQDAQEPHDYNLVSYSDPLLENFRPRPATTPHSPRSKTVTLLQILYLLQQARKLPQSAHMSGQQTLAQIMDLLRRTNQLSPETETTLTKIFTQHGGITPRPSVTINGAVGLNTPTSHFFARDPVDDATLFSSPTVKGTSEPFTTAAYTPISLVNTKNELYSPTPVPEVDTSEGDYDVYQDIPRLQQSLDKEPQQLQITTPTIPTTQLPQVTTPTSVLAGNVDDLSSYKYGAEGPTVDHKGISTPVKAPQREGDELQSYDYAPARPLLPQVFYGLKTQVNNFPDPSSQGSTPGKAGVDYPTYSVIPKTSFSCKTQRYKGFFGDPDTSCQVWHYCDLNGGQASFLCPNGTIFSQVALTCDWWFNVRCSSTTQLYVLNERLYKYILPVTPSFPEDFSGPLVDQYIALKFKEIELKKKNKEKMAAIAAAAAAEKE